MEEEKALDLASIFAAASGLGQQSRAGLAKGAVSAPFRLEWERPHAQAGFQAPLAAKVAWQNCCLWRESPPGTSFIGRC